MRTVEHDGSRYLLLKRSGEASLVYDPETGERTYLPNDELVVAGDSSLEKVARTIPGTLESFPVPIGDERALGLLLEVNARGPIPARELLAEYELCESDLHGMVGELRAAGLLAEADVHGERGYRTTRRADELLEALR